MSRILSAMMFAACLALVVNVGYAACNPENPCSSGTCCNGSCCDGSCCDGSCCPTGECCDGNCCAPGYVCCNGECRDLSGFE